MIIPINDKVASQTISVTINTSLKVTTPKTKATIAPITAVVPICKSLGCQITKISVIIKIPLANILFFPKFYFYISRYIDVYLNKKK